MHKRKLGHTDLELSEIALGTWGLSGAYGHMDAVVAKSTIQAALLTGIRTFDTAPLWGEGKVESILGEELETRRDEVQFITRAGAIWDDDCVEHRFEPDALRQDLEASLERLKSKVIDVWLLHDPPSDVLEIPDGDGDGDGDGDAADVDADGASKANEPANSASAADKEADEEKNATYALCEELKKEGKIKQWGISTSNVDSARSALKGGAKALCLPFNLLNSDDLHDLEGEIALAGAGVLARSPLFHGLLAGRWTEYRQFGDSDHRKARWTRNALTVRVRQVNQLRYLVHDDITSLATAAVRFVLSSSVVTSCLLGARRPLQIRNAKAMAGDPPYLPEDDMMRLGQVLSAVGA